MRSYTSLHLLHHLGGPSPPKPLRAEHTASSQPLALSCLGEVAACACHATASDKTHMKTIRICNTSQSLLKTAVLIHNNSCYNKRAFKDFKSELIYSSDCIKN